MNFFLPFSQFQHWLILSRKIIVIAILFTSWIYAYKPILRSIEFMSVRNMGMGWAYTSVANDESVLYANPAGIGIRRRLFQIAYDESVFYFFPLRLGNSENLFRNLITPGESINKYFSIFGTGTPASSTELTSPTDFIYIGKPWAISFISRGSMNVFNNEVDRNNFYYSRISSQIKVGYNFYSFSVLSHKDLHLAFSGKIMYLLQLERNLSDREMSSRFQNLIEKYPGFVTKENLSNFIGETIGFFEGFALGIDFGLLWEIHLGDSEHQINLGIMVEDAPTYGFSAQIATGIVMDEAYKPVCEDIYDQNPQSFSPNISRKEYCKYEDHKFKGAQSTFFRVNGKFGLAYMLPDYWGGFFSDTMIAFDIHRIGDSDYSFSEMYHVGISSTIFDLTDPRTGYSYQINLSLGISQNQINAGYLVHLNIYEIGYNYFREKVIGYDEVNHRHVVTFAFYF